MAKNKSGQFQDEWGRSKARDRYGAACGGTMRKADGGATFTRFQDRVNDAGARGAVNVARGLNAASRATGLPYNKGAVSVQTGADMREAEEISREVPRRKE